MVSDLNSIPNILSINQQAYGESGVKCGNEVYAILSNNGYTPQCLNGRIISLLDSADVQIETIEDLLRRVKYFNWLPKVDMQRDNQNNIQISFVGKKQESRDLMVRIGGENSNGPREGGRDRMNAIDRRRGQM